MANAWNGPVRPSAMNPKASAQKTTVKKATPRLKKVR